MYQESGSGYTYKTKIGRILKNAGLQPRNFNPKKNDPTSIDSIIVINGQNYNIEIKNNLSDVDFGYASLMYDPNNYRLRIQGSNDSMSNILATNKIEDQINQRWSILGPPKKFTVSEDEFTFKDAYYDFNKFKPFFLRIPHDSVSKYYNGKNTYYMQIGGRGFYFMNANPARISSMVDLSLEVRVQVRLKRNRSYPANDYTFSLSMRAVPGTLVNTENDIEDETFITKISSMNK